jgi:hypothetical protein
MGKVKKVSTLRPSAASLKKSKENKDKSSSLAKHGVKKKSKTSHILKVGFVGIMKTISKKEKQKLKKQKVKEKIELTKAAFKEDKARKKRQKTAVVGDLKPLLDSLPSLDELLTLRDSSNKTGIAAIDRRIPKQPKTKTEKRRFQLNEKTEKMLDRFDHVQKIWRSPEFQKNPRKLIAEQIRQKRLEKANEMET